MASYVVLINKEFSNAGSEDVVYVPEKSTTTVSYTNSDGDKKTGYATELYFLDGSGKTETVTVVGQKTPASIPMRSTTTKCMSWIPRAWMR